MRYTDFWFRSTWRETSRVANVMVVGGAGYIGSVLVRALLDQDYSVTVLDRMYFGSAGIDGIRYKLANVILKDMREVSYDDLENMDAVINLGGLSNDPTADYNPVANHEMNVVATTEIARKCREMGIRRYVFASSCSIYDRQGDTDIVFDEESEVIPRWHYSMSKYEAERNLLDMVDNNFCPVILRKGTVYGYSPRMRFDLVVNTMMKDTIMNKRVMIHNGGEMWRPLVHINDVAAAYIRAIRAPEDMVRGEIFNISRDNYRISEIALRLSNILKVDGQPIQIAAVYGMPHVRSYRVSNAKSRTVLGFEPIISLETGLMHMGNEIIAANLNDVWHPRYNNIEWMKILDSSRDIIGCKEKLF